MGSADLETRRMQRLNLHKIIRVLSGSLVLGLFFRCCAARAIRFFLKNEYLFLRSSVDNVLVIGWAACFACEMVLKSVHG